MAERRSVDPAVLPSGTGCVECLAAGGWWFHLRRCAQCGHIGCCDSSPSQHASAHARGSGHSVIRTFEPGEDWFYDYRSGECAHQTIAKGTVVTVTNLANGATTTCVVTDRGPYQGDRIIDLDRGTIDQIADSSQGVIQVRITW